MARTDLTVSWVTEFGMTGAPPDDERWRVHLNGKDITDKVKIREISHTSSPAEPTVSTATLEFLDEGHFETVKLRVNDLRITLAPKVTKRRIKWDGTQEQLELIAAGLDRACDAIEGATWEINTREGRKTMDIEITVP